MNSNNIALIWMCVGKKLSKIVLQCERGAFIGISGNRKSDNAAGRVLVDYLN